MNRAVIRLLEMQRTTESASVERPSVASTTTRSGRTAHAWSDARAIRGSSTATRAVEAGGRKARRSASEVAARPSRAVHQPVTEGVGWGGRGV